MSAKKPTGRKEQKKRKKRNALIAKTVLLCVLIVVLFGAIWLVTGGAERIIPGAGHSGSSSVSASSDGQEENSPTSTGTPTQSPEDQKAALISQAEAKAVQYDYDGAIELLNTIEGADQDADVITLIADYETQKKNLVATTPDKVTHIFFHSLVVDPDRGFSMKDGDTGWNSATAGFCQWMTTVDEFNAILQQMYDRGFVLVDLDDMIERTTDENGTVHITAKNIMLPQGKTPFVLSLDDLSYYYSYDGRGTASKMIIGDDGKPTCEYVQADGTTVVGDYDCVPILDAFVEAHPDFSYKGAKGTIALTGYNGILGYRTDYTYRDRVDLDNDQQAWLDAHPDFNWDEECAQAKAVAECLKADGWKFASHTWGHIKVGPNASLEQIQTDTQKWKNYVEPLIGETDKIIFAHGEDLASWNEDYASSPKFQYLKSQGFNVFCNVDSSQYFVQIEDQFLRMGRRNLDGYRLWEAVYGGTDRLGDLIDASSVFDAKRPTDASYYSL